MSNRDNPRKGAEFQKRTAEFLTQKFKKEFILEKKIAIGFDSEEKKEHKFDLVSADDSIAVECKRYTWTETGNVPSAKMGFCNEAAFYLSFLPDSVDKYIVMLESRHPKHDETLAEYYYRMNRHLLGDIKIAEFNPETGFFRVIVKK